MNWQQSWDRQPENHVHLIRKLTLFPAVEITLTRVDPSSPGSLMQLLCPCYWPFPASVRTSVSTPYIMHSQYEICAPMNRLIIWKKNSNLIWCLISCSWFSCFFKKIDLCYRTVRLYMNLRYSLKLFACGLAAKGYKKNDYAVNFHGLYYALRAHSSNALNHVNRQQGWVEQMNSSLILWSLSFSGMWSARQKTKQKNNETVFPHSIWLYIITNANTNTNTTTNNSNDTSHIDVQSKHKWLRMSI